MKMTIPEAEARPSSTACSTISFEISVSIVSFAILDATLDAFPDSDTWLKSCDDDLDESVFVV